MLSGCCPSCGFTGEVEAFLVEPEAKRAIARVAALEPAIGRVIGPYLRLFATGKRGVQLRRAVALIDDLVMLVEAGSVCSDERVGVRRPATPAMWAAGIEQMLASPPSGALGNHNYLRKVVFGLADSADASAERQREASARAGNRRAGPSDSAAAESPLQTHLAWLRQQIEYGAITREQHDEQAAAARIKFGGAS